MTVTARIPPRRWALPRSAALAVALIGLAAPGCTWVSSKDVDDRRPELDDDGDGFVAAEDCDDLDAAIHPGAVEAWYDGIDADCARDDDFDADKDGYVSDAWIGATTAEVEGSGALPGGDCDDDLDSVAPGQPDAWYDGVDTDCDGTDDYDQDGDGYVADAYAGLATTYAEGTGALPAGDCDDAVVEVYPGAADAWYDGVDSDCAGDDDYDQDGDGFVRAGDAGLVTTYAPGTGGLPEGDCDDLDDRINPDAADAWYDGVDSDCAGDDDYDQDLDGFRHPSLPDGTGDDCDDTDPDAWPGNVEVLDDGVDRDCDGADSTFPVLPPASLAWRGPHDLRFAENSSSVFLSVAAEQITYGVTNYYDSALALTWDSTAVEAAAPGILVWLMNLSDPTFSLTLGQGFTATDEELVGAVGLTYTSSGNRSLRFGGYDLVESARFGANTPTTAYAPFDDIAIASDDAGYWYALGCEDEDGVGRYVQATREQLPTTYEVTEEVPDLPASACTLHFFDDSLGTVVSAQADGLVSLQFDPTSSAPFADATACDDGDTGDTGSACPDPSTVDPTVQATDVETVPGKPWLLLADAAADAVVIVFTSGAELSVPVDQPMHARATVAPDNTIYVAYVDGSGVPGLAWGTAALGFTQVELDPGFTATEAAVELTDDGATLLYAALGTNAVAIGQALIE